MTPIDWRVRIVERLAGTAPRHAPQEWLLPGLSVEQTASYRQFFPAHPIPAAVLVPLIERDGELTVLLTQRASQLKNHAGQISFPGGRIEAQEEPSEAALREAQEEVGLAARYVSIAGYLPDHIILTGFRVTPVVAFVRPGFELALDHREVEDTFEVPLRYVFEPANHRLRRRRLPHASVEIELRDILYGEHNIWGATAGMLLALYRICATPAD